MSTISLTGKDTAKLNGRILSDLADGDTVSITIPDDVITLKKGKNGNSIYAPNAQGEVADVVIRVLRGSDDDKFMNLLLATQKNDVPSFSLMVFDFAKRIGDGSGNVISDLNSLSGGVFTKGVPDSKENVDGDTETAVAIYTLKFSGSARLIA